MTTAITESLYASRLRDYFEKNYYLQIGKIHYGRYAGNRRSFVHVVESEYLGMDIHEEEYKGFQIVIVNSRHRYREITDSNGGHFQHMEDALTHTIAHRGEWQDASYFIAYAWEIGRDLAQTIHYPTQYACVNGIGESNSLAKTRKVATKKIDILASIKAVQPQLALIADQRLMVPWDEREKYIPFNVLVGDEVFIQAYGRKRKGVVVGTTGSRFIVGYVTPSNHSDLRYKILPQTSMFVPL